jgi:dolichyl-diphosphooligosaccharide--protein glycosyltransferase
MVEQGVREGVIREVYNKFPQYDPLAKEKLIKNEISEYKKQNKKTIKKQIQGLYLNLIDRYKDKTGQTYLMELDCWHWARYVANVLRYGHPGDEVRDGKQFDNLMLSPLGSPLPWNKFLFYFSAFAYKLFYIFKPVPLFTFLFYLPLLFATIFIVVLYLFSRSLAGTFGAVITCLYVGLSPIFIPRSCGGWFDMDILNLLLPVSIMWTYLMSCEVTSLRSRLLWVCFSSFLVGLFCFTWVNWWFIFFIIIMYEIFSLAAIALLSWRRGEKNPALLKEHALRLLLFLLFSIFWIVVLSGLEPLAILYTESKNALSLNKPLLSSIWPNVFSTVGELRKLRLGEMPNSSGDSLIFKLALLCILILIIRALFTHRYSGFKRDAIIILTLWFLNMSFASMRGIRFTVFLLIPLSISLGWVFNEIYHYFRNTHRSWTGLLAVIAVYVFIILGFVDKAYNTAKGILPLIDDTWYNVLNIINEKTSSDAVLNSWWDFGDWFKVVAQRRVIFDGQSQNVPQAYWMAKALLSGNEDEAMGILRMLNNGGNEAFEAIDKYLKDPQKSVLLLESVISADPERAKAALLDFLPYPVAAEVLRLLFSRPPDAYFIVDPSMPSKISAISYLGNWNFSKVYMAQNFNKEEKGQITDYLVKLGRARQEVQRLYQEAFLISPKDLDSWLSHPLQFYSGIVRGQKKGNTVFFSNGFLYNPNEQTIYTNDRQIPRSLFVMKDDNLIENIYTNGNLNFSALVVKDGEYYKLILLDRELANSLFVRLYYLGGQGLRHFKPFIDAGQGDEHIRVFRTIW